MKLHQSEDMIMERQKVNDEPNTEPHRVRDDRCMCNLRTRLLGDGCQYCNSEYAAALSALTDPEGENEQ